ncbi:MAG: CoA-transferase, partial [Rhizobacter sp.]|nr:CoA-transferase [Rhizobacter sp.]
MAIGAACVATKVSISERASRSEAMSSTPSRKAATCVADSGVAQAADGLVALGCGTAQQWHDLCAMSGHDEWIDEQSPLT